MEEDKKVEPIALAVEPETIAAVVVEAEPEVVEKQEAAAPAPASIAEGKKLPGAGIFIQHSALKHNSRAKNSRSVASVQARLIELGFAEAGNDNRGTFGDSTLDALCAFHKDSKVKADSCVDKSVIEALFKGTAVEVVD